MTLTLKTAQSINAAQPVQQAGAQGQAAEKATALTDGNLASPSAAHTALTPGVPGEGRQSAPRLLDQLTEAARQQGHTEEAAKGMAEWCRRFVMFHGKRHPREMGLTEIGRFLQHVAATEKDAPGAMLSRQITIKIYHQGLTGRDSMPFSWQPARV